MHPFCRDPVQQKRLFRHKNGKDTGPVTGRPRGSTVLRHSVVEIVNEVVIGGEGSVGDDGRTYVLPSFRKQTTGLENTG